MSVRPLKTQISLGIRPVRSESLLCAQWVVKDPSFLHADSEDSDQTGRLPRLILIFAGGTAIFLVLSCHGSNVTRIIVIKPLNVEVHLYRNVTILYLNHTLQLEPHHEKTCLCNM